jgi:5-(aminomethyl)-3-furanmethanol phosphate kinase
MNAPCLHLYKVGGSLLRTAQWREVMQRVLDHSLIVNEVPMFLIGGGALVDAVRALCAAHQVPEQTEHGMSLLAMQQNALLVASQFPELEKCDSEEAAFMHLNTYTPGIWSSLAHISKGLELYASNSITSDSIALYLAHALALHAQTQRIACKIAVTLLKSCEVSETMMCDAQALMQHHMVDDAFPEFAARLLPYTNASWRVVNAQAAFMAART